MNEKQFKNKLVEWYNDYKISIRVEYWLDPETNEVVLDKQEMRQSLRSEISRLNRLLRLSL